VRRPGRRRQLQRRFKNEKKVKSGGLFNVEDSKGPGTALLINDIRFYIKDLHRTK
jgi:hypothetical protein